MNQYVVRRCHAVATKGDDPRRSRRLHASAQKEINTPRAEVGATVNMRALAQTARMRFAGSPRSQAPNGGTATLSQVSRRSCLRPIGPIRSATAAARRERGLQNSLRQIDNALIVFPAPHAALGHHRCSTPEHIARGALLLDPPPHSTKNARSSLSAPCSVPCFARERRALSAPKRATCRPTRRANPDYPRPVDSERREPGFMNHPGFVSARRSSGGGSRFEVQSDHLLEQIRKVTRCP